MTTFPADQGQVVAPGFCFKSKIKLKRRPRELKRISLLSCGQCLLDTSLEQPLGKKAYPGALQSLTAFALQGPGGDRKRLQCQTLHFFAFLSHLEAPK